MVGTIALAIAKARSFEIRSSKTGFQMFPDFEWSDFRSPLYSTTRIVSTVIMTVPIYFSENEQMPEQVSLPNLLLEPVQGDVRHVRSDIFNFGYTP